MGEHGKTLMPDGGSVLTHCNTGALATSAFGTALGVIRAGWEDGKRFRVFNTETRPWLQGARLTSWEFRKLGIPATLLVDSAAGSLMRRGEIGCVITGADRIAANGDTANKIGTYSLAVLGPGKIAFPSTWRLPPALSTSTWPTATKLKSRSALKKRLPAFAVNPPRLRG